MWCVSCVQLSSWYTQVGEALIKQYTDMGVNLTTAQDYIDTHQTLLTDLKVQCVHCRRRRQCRLETAFRNVLREKYRLSKSRITFENLIKLFLII